MDIMSRIKTIWKKKNGDKLVEYYVIMKYLFIKIAYFIRCQFHLLHVWSQILAIKK